MKITVFCPPEGNAPAINATIRLPLVPAVGDGLRAPAITPEAGPGAGDDYFKVVSRVWHTHEPPHLTLTREFGWSAE